MSVYVDDLIPRPCAPDSCFRDGLAFLVADDIHELHAFARKIGLQPHFFYGFGSVEHYDVSASMRAKALEQGAIAITTRKLVRRFILKERPSRRSAVPEAGV